MIYRAEVVEKDKDIKKPEVVYIISEENIVDAAIEATKKMNAQKSVKKLRVWKIEEVPDATM